MINGSLLNYLIVVSFISIKLTESVELNVKQKLVIVKVRVKLKIMQNSLC